MSAAGILIVDDEPGLCELLQRYLRRQGYAAETASSGEEAWDLIRRDTGRFTAFLIDLALPGMTGAGLARKILGAQPTARIVLSSGYVFDPDRIGAAPGRVVFLQKPFPPAQLAAALKDLIGPAADQQTS